MSSFPIYLWKLVLSSSPPNWMWRRSLCAHSTSFEIGWYFCTVGMCCVLRKQQRWEMSFSIHFIIERKEKEYKMMTQRWWWWGPACPLTTSIDEIILARRTTNKKKKKKQDGNLRLYNITETCVATSSTYPPRRRRINLSAFWLLLFFLPPANPPLPPPFFFCEEGGGEVEKVLCVNWITMKFNLETKIYNRGNSLCSIHVTSLPKFKLTFVCLFVCESFWPTCLNDENILRPSRLCCTVLFK